MLKIIFLFLFFLSSSLFAYDFVKDFKEGYYHGSFPVVLRVVKGGNVTDKRLTQTLAMVEEAVKDWNDKTGKNIFTVDHTIGDDNGSGYVIRWGDVSSSSGFDSSATLAVTTRSTDGTHYNRVTVTLNTSLLSHYGEQTLFTTIAHELGHVVGMGHSSDYAVMAAKLGSAYEPVDDDINGMNALYAETKERQDTGFSVAKNDDKGGLGCGTVSLIDSDGGNGPTQIISILSFLSTLVAGMWVVGQLKKVKKIKI